MNLLPLLLPGQTFITKNRTMQFGNDLPAGSPVTYKEPISGNYHKFIHNGKEFCFTVYDIERPSVNMEICLPGQVLISKHGKKYVFVKNDKENFQDFPYRISSLEDFEKNGPEFFNASRTVEGWTYRNKPSINDEDIVEIRNERVFTFEQVKAFLEENPHVLINNTTVQVSLGLVIRFDFLNKNGQEDSWVIHEEFNPTIKLVDSSFFALDSLLDEEFQFQILTVKSNF